MNNPLKHYALSLGFLLGLLSPLQAQPSPAANQKLKFILILSRHGVRSPTKSNDQLAPYASDPWPVWPVAPGELTARGGELLELFGAYDRAWFAHEKLLPATGCGDADTVYFLPDTDQRTIASAKSLVAGMYPGCTVPLHGLAAGVSDALFHPLAAGIGGPPAADALKALQERLQGDPSRSVSENRAALDLLQHVLAPDAAHPPQRSLFAVVPGIAPGKGDHPVDLAGPLATASSLSENILLEYADGMPMKQVGWGRADEASLRTLLTLHTAYFDLIHRAPLLAQAEASNLFVHILATLEQAARGSAEPQAIGPVGTRIVVLAGHDTNLAGMAALLGLHWTLDGRADDTPPGSELAFELWEDTAARVQTVRISFRMQTLEQMRQVQRLSLASGPATATVTPRSCEPCTVEAFRRLANTAVNPAFMRSDK